MARARNLKPSFFTNDQLAECQPLARLLFAGLWCVADRAGRLEERPKRIKAEVLPYDTCNVEKLLAELASRGFIQRYEVNGAKFIQIKNFEKHQDPHVREKASTIPAPCEHGASTVPVPLNPFVDSPFLNPESPNPAPPADGEPAVPDGVLPHVWRDWQKHRGKKLSRESVRRQTERLAELRAMGHDPNAVILQSIERGWTGLFEVKARANGVRDPTLAEKRAANMDRLTGRVRDEPITVVAERVGGAVVRALPGDLRKPGGDDVGGRGPGGGAASVG
jgi:hypothetical protein